MLAWRLAGLIRLLTSHLLRDIFRSLPQLVLIPRQRFELTLQFFRTHLLTIAREILLTSEQLVLTPREILDLVDGTRLLIVRRGRTLGCFVIRLLMPGQLLVEEARQVLNIAVAAGSAACLLLLNLPLLHVGLRLQQLVEGFHLRRHGVGGLQRFERRDRMAHRRRGQRHRIFLCERLARAQDRRRRRPAAATRPAATSRRPAARIPHR